jgi:glutathione peroxidase
MMRRLFLAAAAAALAGPALTAQPRVRQSTGRAHDFTFTDIDGNPLPLAQFAGRPMLVVNTASRCGFTGQYAGLQSLWTRYRDRGLVVIGVPSNDFRQELSEETAVRNFCELNYGVDFPLTEISRVTGPQAHPFYRWAADVMGTRLAPRWNFHKYLVDGEGRLVASFATGVEPTSRQVTSAIEGLLPRRQT